jgi:hypothetical protein
VVVWCAVWYLPVINVRVKAEEAFVNVFDLFLEVGRESGVLVDGEKFRVRNLLINPIQKQIDIDRRGHFRRFFVLITVFPQILTANNTNTSDSTTADTASAPRRRGRRRERADDVLATRRHVRARLSSAELGACAINHIRRIVEMDS